MFIVLIHSLIKFLKGSFAYSPYVYTPWCSLGWNFLQGFENLKPYSLLMLWEFWPICLCGYNLLSFPGCLRYLQAPCRRGGKIWITSWGMRGINPCESRRLLLKSLHNEVFHVFAATVNSPLTSFILHCLSSYIYIDDTLYKQFIEVYSWFVSILKTFFKWIVSITCFVSTSQIYL